MPKPKLLIIDVNLGIDINTIISEDVAELSTTAKEKLETAIQSQKQLYAIRDEKNAEKKAASDALAEVMQKAYDLILNTNDGASSAQILHIVQPHIATLSAFSLRMKTMLRERGNDYILEKKGSGARTRYILTPFNLEQPQP